MNSTMDASLRSLNSPPQDYVCPITMSLMSNPMRSSKTNHCYEREAILNWIYRGNPLCPVTRTPIHPDDLTLDIQLQAQILKWKINQECSNDPSSCGDFDESDADFEATLQDILEITNRIKEVTVETRGSPGRLSLPANHFSSSSKPQQEPIKRASRGCSSLLSDVEGGRRLSDIRFRVLQQREDRIKRLSMSSTKSDSKQEQPEGDNSLGAMLRI